MLVVVEFCEEAEGAETEGEDGGDDALEEPGGVEDGAVAAELHLVSAEVQVVEITGKDGRH